MGLHLAPELPMPDFEPCKNGSTARARVCIATCSRPAAERRPTESQSSTASCEQAKGNTNEFHLVAVYVAENRAICLAELARLGPLTVHPTGSSVKFKPAVMQAQYDGQESSGNSSWLIVSATEMNLVASLATLVGVSRAPGGRVSGCP